MPTVDGMEKSAFISTFLARMAVEREPPVDIAARIEVEDKAFSGLVTVGQFSIVVKSDKDSQEHFEVPLYCLKTVSYEDSRASLQLMLAPEDCKDFSVDAVETVTLDMEFLDQSRLAQFSEALGRVVNSECMEGPEQDLLDALASPNEDYISADAGDGSEPSSQSNSQPRKLRKTCDFASTKDLEELVFSAGLSANKVSAHDVPTSSMAGSITSIQSPISQPIDTEQDTHQAKSRRRRVEFASTKDLEAAGEIVTWSFSHSDRHDAPGSSDVHVDPGTDAENGQAALQASQATQKATAQHTPSRQTQEAQTLLSPHETSCGSKDGVGVGSSHIQASAASIGLGAEYKGEACCTAEDARRLNHPESQSKLTAVNSSISQHTLLSAVSPVTTTRRDRAHTSCGQERRGGAKVIFPPADTKAPVAMFAESPGAHQLPQGLHGCRSFPSPFVDIMPRKKRTYTQGHCPHSKQLHETSPPKESFSSYGNLNPAQPEDDRESVVRMLVRATESIENGKHKLLNLVHSEFKNAESEIQQKFLRLIECQKASFDKLAINVETEKRNILKRMQVLPDRVPEFNLEFKHPAFRAVLAEKEAGTDEAAGISVQDMIRAFKEETHDKLRGIQKRVLGTRDAD
ncbi:hypothetical protein TGARI_270280 [Toxoplasma gondii ARI]|uniref:Uncharacterized protein n=1 Tax=Toxoplasma gondii ARI TaxID=1074872 RepID=A0A139Y6W9_TOXGO|nr:hypothetical protein TGARI_270280 [Toxoplasma gondii ARI]